MEQVRKYLINDKDRPCDKSKTVDEVDEDIKNLESRVLRIVESFLENNKSLAIDISVKTVEGNPASTIERLDFVTDVRFRKCDRLENEHQGVTNGVCNKL